SVVLNGSKDVIIARDTRQRVQEAAKQLGYRPNYAARTIKSKKSRTLGMLSPWKPEVWFFADILNGLRQAASENGYGILLCNMLEKEKGPNDCIRYFREGRIDGVIYLPPHTTELPGLSDLADEGIPTVLCNGVSPYGQMDGLVIDYASGIYEAAKYLHEAGFSRLLYIQPDADAQLIPGDIDRIRGFDAAADLPGVTLQKEIFSLQAIGSIEGRMKKAEEIIRRLEGPTGIIACYWNQAYYLETKAAILKLDTERDLKVIAGDCPEFVGSLYPRIVGIDLPFFEIGHLAAVRIISRLEGEADQETSNVLKGRQLFRGGDGAR
ncbi:MAG: LacI family DNA-binding transcriptional regulator, partial [Clostridia bacterium]|nr:LacI family DNA-binding transcriptional regulator [Clostridia bacterium]